MLLSRFQFAIKFSSTALLAASLLLPSMAAQAQEAQSDSSKKAVTASKKPQSKVILETNRGNITLELFDNDTPKTVKNFISYIDDGFYNDTVFHRVIPGFVIQGGGFSKELAKKKTKKPIKNEASDKLRNTKGSVAMARLSAPHTATSQFFINLKDNRSLDYREYNPGYTVFGRVTEGMNIVETIAKAKTSNIGMHKDVPIDAIIIHKAYVIKNQPVQLNSPGEATIGGSITAPMSQADQVDGQ